MDPNIILGGRGVNALGAITAANQAVGQQQAFKAQNALAPVLQQSAELRLKQENALAPMEIQREQLGIQQQQAQIAAIKQNTIMAAQEQVAKMTAQQVAAEQAKTETALKGWLFLAGQGDQAGADAFLKQQGIDPTPYRVENAPMVAAMGEGLMEVYKTFNPVAPTGGDRFKVVGSQLVDLAAPGGPASVMQDAGQTETVYGPDGQPILTRGPAAQAKPFTEAQSKDVGFATRARGALEILDPIAGSLTNRWDVAKEVAPWGMGRGFQTPDYQLAQQAGLEFLVALLRKDTGAAVTDAEEATYGRIYLPQVGDLPETLKAKAAARQRAVAALEAGMSPAQILAQEKALASAPQPDAPPPETADQPAPAPVTSGPQPGVTEDGYQFLGGDPADPANWQKVN